MKPFENPTKTLIWCIWAGGIPYSLIVNLIGLGMNLIIIPSLIHTV